MFTGRVHVGKIRNRTIERRFDVEGHDGRKGGR